MDSTTFKFLQPRILFTYITSTYQTYQYLPKNDLNNINSMYMRTVNQKIEQNSISSEKKLKAEMQTNSYQTITSPETNNSFISTNDDSLSINLTNDSKSSIISNLYQSSYHEL